MSQSNLHVIVGLGATGLSCAQFLRKKGIPVAITDTRENPPHLSALQKDYPDILISLGKLDEDLLSKAACIVLSPGIAKREATIAAQAKKGIPVIGDIELFARAVTTPVIAITGTNAKSTVTTLVGEMAAKAGFNVQVGGNLGVPVLNLLSNPQTNLYVLELSSFQLETTYSLKPSVATVLNVTPDHMDRYETLEEYQQTKQRVYQNCSTIVCNLDDPLTNYESSYLKQKFYFTLSNPGANEFGLQQQQNKTYLAFGNEILLSTDELPIKGKHYQANALAALAIGHGYGLPFSTMLSVLREFKGLPHRCQFVRERNHITWYNDSKGTNVGATYAAIEGLGSEIKGKLILIAGGLGKNADFSPLLPIMLKYVRHIVLIGEAAKDLSQVIGNTIPISFANNMEEAIQQSDHYAKAGDSVLLSPACASYDMFKNFEHRGQVFTSIVESL